MKTRTITIVENGKMVGELLLDSLKESEVLSESKYKKMHARQIITEASESVETVAYKGHQISRDVFAAVYSNLSKFDTREAIFIGLGFKPEEIREMKADSRRTALNRIIDEFNKNADPNANHELFPKWQQRIKHYTSESRQEAGWDEPGIDDIDAGHRGRTDRTTRVVQNINSQDLLSGEFYSDRSRIPRTRWAGWLRFWNRKKTSVRPDGGRWKKTFILGYQVERNVIYEIWYNSIDSTFTLHDRGGIEMSGRLKTMVEAIRHLIRAIAQESDNDAAFLSGSTPEAQALSNSVTRALTKTTDQRAEQLEKADRIQAKRERAERINKHKRRVDAARDAEQRRNKHKDFLNSEESDSAWAEMERSSRSSAKGKVSASFKNLSTATQKVMKQMDLSVEEVKNILITGSKMSYDNLSKFIQKELDLDKRAVKQMIEDFVKLFPENFGDLDWHELNKNQGKQEKWTNQNRKEAGYDKKRENRMKKSASKIGKHLSQADDEDGASADERMRRDAAKTAEEREKQLIKDLAKKRRSKKGLNESEEFVNIFEQEDPLAALDDLISDEVDSSSYESEIRKIRSAAERSPYTQQALGQSVMGEITTYDETRVRASFMASWFDNTVVKGSIKNIFRGRKIALPTDKPSVFKRAKMAFKGQRYRADFVIGWTLSDRINLEVWYVTEPNPTYDPDDRNSSPMIASFYVFDVTSGSIVRRFIPHYRNALQIVMGKLSPLL